jgi:hypothetical protein
MSDALEGAIEKRLNFSDETQFAETAKFMEFLVTLYGASQDTYLSDRQVSRITDYLEEALLKKEGSYFLNIQAQDLLARYGLGNASQSESDNTYSRIDQMNDSDHEALYTDEDVRSYNFLAESLSPFIQNDLQIDLNQIPLRQRFQFLNFIKTKPATEMDQVRNMTQEYGELALRTFLSLEQDKTTGDDIIFLSEKLDEESARAIFQKYSDLVDTADEAERYVTERLPAEKVSASGIEKVREKILHQGKDLLKNFASEVRGAENTTSEEKPLNFDPQTIFQKLDRINRDGILFTETLKGLDGAKLEDMVGASFEAISPQEISPEQKTSMQKMYAENYTSTPKFQRKLLEGFEDLLGREEGVAFQVFKDGENIRGFYALQEIGENKLNFKAFNLDSSYTGVRLGEELMLKGLDQAAESAIIEAQCDGDNFISSAYIERGFIATGAFSFEDELEHALDIVRNDSQNDQFETKKLSRDEVKDRATKESLERQFDVEEHEQNLTQFFVKSKMTTHDYAKLAEDDGWVLTRSISDRETGDIYLAYEQIGGERVEEYRGNFNK